MRSLTWLASIENFILFHLIFFSLDEDPKISDQFQLKLSIVKVNSFLKNKKIIKVNRLAHTSVSHVWYNVEYNGRAESNKNWILILICMLY